MVLYLLACRSASRTVDGPPRQPPQIAVSDQRRKRSVPWTDRATSWTVRVPLASAAPSVISRTCACPCMADRTVLSAAWTQSRAACTTPHTEHASLQESRRSAAPSSGLRAFVRRLDRGRHGESCNESHSALALLHFAWLCARGPPTTRYVVIIRSADNQRRSSVPVISPSLTMRAHVAPSFTTFAAFAAWMSGHG